jgi:transcriptional regulator with XRE-family HTH domain
MVNGAAIQRRRKQAGLTLAELGDRAGVTASMVSYIELGLRSPSVAALALIAKALGCTMDELLRGGETEERR